MNQAAYQLTVLTGPNSGQIFSLTKSETILGRDENADIVIPAPIVSRRHARITLRDNRYWIEDLGSANGTFINGNQVSFSSMALTDKDHIQFGQVITIVFERVAIQQDATRIGRE